MFKWAQRFVRIFIVFFTLATVGLSFMLAYYVFGLHNLDRLTKPKVAFWMEHKWSTAERSNFEDLANKLKRLPSSKLFFHVGPLNPDGGLADDLEFQAENFASLPSDNYAWIGQLRSEIDLENPIVRANIIESGQWLLSQGFDGIHLNIEPVRADDEAFLLLLQEMDAALPDVPISIAMDEWQPDMLTQFIARLFNTSIVSYWTSEQVLNFRQYVDEFVVMTYDTGFKDSKLYSFWVEHQIVALSKLMDDETSLLIGLPVYEEGTSFNPEAENLESGLIGYTKGISNIRSNLKAIDGIALYPYWEMDKEEWQILNSYLNHEIDLSQ